MNKSKTKTSSNFSFIKKGMKRINRGMIIDGLIYTFLAIYLIALVFIPMADSTSQWYIVTSSSMEPTLDVGDMVYVSDVDPKNIQEGDIITFKDEDSESRITHRCVEVVKEDNELYFRTKGDANEEIDKFIVHDENVIGKIDNHKILGLKIYNKIPRLGYLSQFSKTFLGFFMLILLPGIALIGMETYNIMTTIFKDEEESQDENDSTPKQRFDQLSDITRSKLKSVRNTDIDIEKIVSLVKSANSSSKGGDYVEANSNCEEAIKMIDDYLELQEEINGLKTRLNDLHEDQEEYIMIKEKLDSIKMLEEEGLYRSALKLINSGELTLLRRNT